jgi:ligand-binding SRPBCC domain-containing protein
VFSFFADARNLEAITPAFLHFAILPPVPDPMSAGSLIDYRLSLFGVPFRWRTLIEVWEPARRFVDVQLRGPYAEWHHTHVFEDAPGGTRILDRVRYRLPLGPLGRLAHPILVRRMLERIFDHRAAAVAARMTEPGPSPRAG